MNGAWPSCMTTAVVFGTTAALGIGCVGTRAALRNKEISRSCPALAVKWANTPVGWSGGKTENSAEKAVLIADTRSLWGGLKLPSGPVTVCSAEDWATILVVCEPLAAATSAPMVLSFGADVSLVPPVGKEAQERFDKELPHLKITVTPSFVFAGRRGRGHWLFTVTVEQPPPKTDTGFFGKK